MIVLLVLGIVVLALVLFSLIRVGVWVEYAQKTFTLRLLAGPVKITLFPRKEKQPKKPRRVKKKKKKQEKQPKTAVNYGKLNGAIGMFWPLVEQNFKVKAWRIRTNVDFTTEHPTVYLRAAATLTIGQIFALGVRVASKVLPILTQPKSGNKSRQETQKEAV